MVVGSSHELGIACTRFGVLAGRDGATWIDPSIVLDSESIFLKFLYRFEAKIWTNNKHAKMVKMEKMGGSFEKTPCNFVQKKFNPTSLWIKALT